MFFSLVLFLFSKETFQFPGQRITQSLRSSVYSAIVKQEIAFFDKNKTGELINRLSADTSLVSQCVTSNIAEGLRSTTLVVAAVSMMVKFLLFSLTVTNNSNQKDVNDFHQPSGYYCRSLPYF